MLVIGSPLVGESTGGIVGAGESSCIAARMRHHGEIQELQELKK